MIFLNSLEPSTVTVDATERGTWMVRGLPSLRVGTWNGNEFTADDLAAMTAAFGTAQAGGFEPGLWPRHNYDHQGNVMPQDAGAALGFYKSLRFDAERGLLLGDIEVFDEQTARDMERGRLRYVSAEVVRGERDEGRDRPEPDERQGRGQVDRDREPAPLLAGERFVGHVARTYTRALGRGGGDRYAHG